MTGGMVSMEMARALVRIGNGRVLSGLGRLIGGFFKNLRANSAYRRALQQDAQNVKEGRETA